MRRWVIRADASIHIGTGHVMRCLVLAKQIRALGDTDISFICRDDPGHLAELIRNQGFVVNLLPAETHPFSWQLDARQVLDCLGTETIDWLVVDHYGIDSRWEAMLRSRTRKILVIDDLANRLHECDALLDQNYRLNLEHRYDGLLPDSCITLLGPNYLLLRPEFFEARKNLKRDFSKVNRIHVNFGGTDQLNMSLLAIRAIQALNCTNLLVDVVIGQSNPHQSILRREVSNLSGFELHVQTENMAELIAHADLAIGANGSSTWERCVLGLPTLAIQMADNQQDSAIELGELGVIYNIGDVKQVTVEKLSASLRVFINDSHLRKRMSVCSMNLITESQIHLPTILISCEEYNA